jgi:hypothetical protein
MYKKWRRANTVPILILNKVFRTDTEACRLILDPSLGTFNTIFIRRTGASNAVRMARRTFQRGKLWIFRIAVAAGTSAIISFLSKSFNTVPLTFLTLIFLRSSTCETSIVAWNTLS